MLLAIRAHDFSLIDERRLVYAIAVKPQRPLSLAASRRQRRRDEYARAVRRIERAERQPAAVRVERKREERQR